MTKLFIGGILDKKIPTLIFDLLRIVLSLCAFVILHSKFSFLSQGISVEAIGALVAIHILCFAMLLGYWARTASFIVGCLLITVYYSQLLDFSFFGMNFLKEGSYGSEMRLYVCGVTCILLSMAHLSGHFSISVKEQMAQAWPLYLIRLQFAAIYFWAAISKMNGSFLNGDVFEHVYILNYTGSNFDIAAGSLRIFFQIVAHLTIVIEFLLPWGLMHRRTRRTSVILAILLHLIAASFVPVLNLSFAMIIGVLSFTDPFKIDTFLRNQLSLKKETKKPLS